jgi:hypothetical protein
MPGQPGTLVIKSQPTGAQVKVNDTIVGQATDLSLVVSPGSYKVTVGTPGTVPYCPEKSFPVAAGKTVTIVCEGTKWATL